MSTSLTVRSPFWIIYTVAEKLKLKWLVDDIGSWLATPSRLSWLQGKSWDPFPSIKLAEGLPDKMEIFVIHGDTDRTIPPSHSRVRNPLFWSLFQRGSFFLTDRYSRTQAIVDKLEKLNRTTPRLCIIRGTDHRDTRLRADKAIWNFVKGEKTQLEDSIADLEQTGSAGITNHVGSD